MKYGCLELMLKGLKVQAQLNIESRIFRWIYSGFKPDKDIKAF